MPCIESKVAPEAPGLKPKESGSGCAADKAALAMEAKAYSIEEARAYLPYAKGCVIAIHIDGRWIAKYKNKPKEPRSHSVPFSSNAESFVALVTCLKWAWEVHTLLTGDACPHKINSGLHNEDASMPFLSI